LEYSLPYSLLGNNSTEVTPEDNEVGIWINVDGRHLVCIRSETRCRFGQLLDPVHEFPTRIGRRRVSFADMDGNGTDELVVLTNWGLIAAPLVVAPSRDLNARAPRPGLLIRVHNGYGAVTEVQYQTIQELMLDAAARGEPWAHKVPVVESVVTEIRVHNEPPTSGTWSAGSPWSFDRITSYFYRDPAYDPWERRFLGFRKVRSHLHGEDAVTETTYWFGPCQRDRIVEACRDGSDAEPDKSLVGRPVRIDRFVPGRAEWLPHPGPARWLRSIELFYGSQDPPRPAQGRPVTWAPLIATETYEYDPERPVTFRPSRPAGAGGAGDPLEPAPCQDECAPVTREMAYDDEGNLVRLTERGRQPDGVAHNFTGALSRDDPVVTWLGGFAAESEWPGPYRCDYEHWLCSVDAVSIGTPDVRSGLTVTVPAAVERRYRYRYSFEGDLESVESWLEPFFARPVRSHAAGGRVAGPPPGASDAGQHGRFVTLATYQHDPVLGGTTRVDEGSGLTCTSIAYDPVFGQLPSRVRQHRGECGGLFPSPDALETSFTYDRGFAAVVRRVDPTGGISEVRLDPFGRPSEVFAPNTDDPDPRAVISAGVIRFNDGGPVRWIEATRHFGGGAEGRSAVAFNALGEAVVRFVEEDGRWIAQGVVERDAAGRVSWMSRPFATSIASGGFGSLSAPYGAGAGGTNVSYDPFGRLSQISDETGHAMRGYTYRPFEIELRNARQLLPGAVGFTRALFDGHRRLATREVVTAGGKLTTEFAYAATGEVKRRTQRHDRGPEALVRTRSHDSLGRLVRQEDPDTGAWSYAWDDAGRLVGTSDARGCGVNLFYDGLGRILGEDFSPCTAEQTAYTAPDPATGAGFETLYVYDRYEPGQVNPEPSLFFDRPELAEGRLVAVRDRGSHTRFSYDSRGRIRRVARRIAAPDPAPAGGDPYAAHWFVTRADYDEGDRPTRRTTGIDLPELLVGGQSEAHYAFNTRDLVRSVEGSYGPILREVLYFADGQPSQITYGDLASTVAELAYDTRGRMREYHVHRRPPLLWLMMIPPFYGRPDGSTTQTELIHEQYDYDELTDDLKAIESLAPSGWPAEAATVWRRDAAYDDLGRLRRLDYAYATPTLDAPWQSPFAAEVAAGLAGPMPAQREASRVRWQSFDYDWLGNLARSDDDQHVRYDRSLGAVTPGTPGRGPNQLTAADGLSARYDPAGNLIELKVERPGDCPDGAANRCAQWLIYDWDETGALGRVRRWDFDGNVIPPGATPTDPASFDLSFAYSLGTRVRKTVRAAGEARHTLEIFDSLRFDSIRYIAATNDWELEPRSVRGYIAGTAEVLFDARLPRLSGTGIHVALEMGDHLGSTELAIDAASSEVIERTTYLAYGGVENDYRPARWRAFREPYKFTGKEEDAEPGVVYFGARYYHPRLMRWISPDPLAVHGLGVGSSPYAYVSGRVTTQVDPVGLQTSAPDDDCPQCVRLPDDYITGSRPRPEPPRSSEPTPSTPTETGRAEVAAAVAASRGDIASSRGEAAAEIAQGREWAAAPPNHYRAGQAESSAGGFVFPTQVSKSELLATQHPSLAPSIRGAERERIFLDLAPWMLGGLISELAAASELLVADEALGGSVGAMRVWTPAEYLAKMSQAKAGSNSIRYVIGGDLGDAEAMFDALRIETEGIVLLPRGAGKMAPLQGGGRVILRPQGTKVGPGGKLGGPRIEIQDADVGVYGLVRKVIFGPE
jgi:RHS repeat-associated protein